MQLHRQCAGALAGLALLACAGTSRAQGFYGGPNAGAAQGGNPFLGTWSAQTPSGFMTIDFQPNGIYAITSRLPNDTLTRSWGQYRVQQVGPSQWQLATQTTGYLPRQVCVQAMSTGQRTCSPANMPMSSSRQVETFDGSGTMTSNAGESWQRDWEGGLARAQVPEVGVQMVQGPPPAPMPDPYTPPTITPYRSPNVAPYGNNNLQQERICSINNGTIAIVGGQEKCIAPY